jgi:uncharacterized protein (TIGR02569 family)
MDRLPSDLVLRAFGVPARPVPLAGGEGRAVHAGDVVLKLCDDPVEWAWLARWLPTIDQDGFRLALPLSASDGRWVVDGWCAQAAVAGDHAGRWLDVLEVGRRFHTALTHIPRPDFIDARTHPWSVGDRVAWGELDPPVSDPLLARLLAVRAPVDLPSQVVHGDLTENVLFATGVVPAVIDVTPYWRPACYAAAVVVGDAIRWHDAAPGPLLAASAEIEGFGQLFVRAVIFRLVTTLLFAREGSTSYEAVVRVAEEHAGAG